VAPFAFPADDAPLRLLVLGGSQGAHVFAAVVPQAIGLLAAPLRARLHISQQCRPEDLAAVRAAYAGLGAAVDLACFFNDVPQRMAEAHLVVARAGASTVAELAVAGRPSILVPYPYAADDHQAANARAVGAAGAGWPIPQSSLSPEALAELLRDLFGRPHVLAAAALAARAISVPDAAQRLAGLVGDVSANTRAAGALRRRPVL
jgi:UDP-N-acetylglucosamine--N-acetylmuramyl-(pentapeptide) pyrophosphoryl-undecaprenol N-acetylglucosamine transferase